MQTNTVSFRLNTLLSLIAITTLLTSTQAFGQHEKFLHSFGVTSTDGVQPRAGLVMDASGNLYGTTSQGGTGGIGTVFELSPKTGGGWSYKVIHNFANNGVDGNYPNGSLIIDASGNLYGTTRQGGFQGLGMVFEMVKSSTGGWTEKVLHAFRDSNDGIAPFAGLVFDSAGNLYGTTEGGGVGNSDGTVFELSPTSSGSWTENILFSFGGTNDANPECALVLDSAGNLYGTTIFGGANGLGSVFELSYSAGVWSEAVLYSFSNNGTDPVYPFTGLAIDPAGNLYGSGVEGAAFGGGAIFELTPNSGSWTYTIIYSFNFNNNHDGINPEGNLILDSAGNLYGTTNQGGTGTCTAFGCGTVFKLSPSGGSWTETVLHNFMGADGENPVASLILDASGNLYGTTLVGGSFSQGIAFEITHP
jgi:uncharacterized repeat protein (TIGR03803 family)